MPLTIGNVKLKSRVVMAPMAGVTDIAYRLILEEMGAGLVTTEMVSAKAILYQNKNNEQILQTEVTEPTIFSVRKDDSVEGGAE